MGKKGTSKKAAPKEEKTLGAAAEESTADAAEETAAEEKPSKDSVTVSWRGKTRVFSKDVHGKDFVKFAEQFAKKHGGEVLE